MLGEYGRKRDFSKTPEPAPEKAGSRDRRLSFVIHKHAARSLHYDLRLESDGVLKSWAVPAGPSLNPNTKRLAVAVEDHPLDYAAFEGVIPEGQYGAGQVIIWDNGAYIPGEDAAGLSDRSKAEEKARQGLEKGKLSFRLEGKKLKGSWALVRMRGSRNPSGENWLLIKHADEAAGDQDNLLEQDRSVVSGRTIEDLKAGDTQGPSRRRAAATKNVDRPSTHTVMPGKLPEGAVRARVPKAITPMLATLTDAPFSGPDWFFEPKLDGFRAISFIENGKVRLQSRRGLDNTAIFPAIAEELGRQPGQMVLDGEVVALENGRPCFQCLQQSLKPDSPPGRTMEIVYFVFDLLHLGGYDLTKVKFEDRKELLNKVLAPSEKVQLVEAFPGEGEALYQAAIKKGIEGVVAKKKGSPYRPGARSRDWLKVKAVLSDEFIIGGYTAGQGTRAHWFGSLLLGQYDGDGRLVYTGNVGTGFDDRLLKELKQRLDSMKSDKNPFSSKPPGAAGVTWVQPQLVAEIKFSERTHEGILRAPVFLRLREDKPAPQVTRTEIVHPTEGAGMNAHTVQEKRGKGTGPAPADIVRAVLSQLEHTGDKFTLDVDGDRFQVNNLNKPLWPARDEQRALTKRDLLAYLARASAYVLPHLRDRPLTLTRYPNGITGERFYQKHYDDGSLPSFVETVPIFEHDSRKSAVQDYTVCNNLATLLWLGQIADLELHTWFSRIKAGRDGPAERLLRRIKEQGNKVVHYPDFMVFDLDPYIYAGTEKKGQEPELNRAAFQRTSEVAVWLKEVLDGLSLSAYVKTTGKTGLHIFVPIVREFGYSTVRAAAEAIARHLMGQHPDDITMEWAVAKRTGKIFIDHNRNARGQTLASVYSHRPVPEATVSTPLRWDELGKAYPTNFTILNAPGRMAETGDLWADILDRKGDLGGLVGKPSPDSP